MLSVIPAISTDIAGIIILIFTIISLQNNTIMNKTRTSRYMLAVLLTLAAIILEIMTEIFNELPGPDWRIPNIIANVLGFSIGPVIPIAIALLFYEKLYSLMKYLVIPLVFQTVICILSAWTGWVFSISANNDYSRGPLYIVNLLVVLYSFFILVYANHIGSRELQHDQRFYLAMLYVVILFGNAVQILFPNILLIWICAALSILLYYNFLNEMQYRYDPTTGIQTRYSFEKALAGMRKFEYATIFVFDLNNLKDINDKFGHIEGDTSLTVAADSIKNSFRELGTAYRIGGDEFCVLCPGEIGQDKIDETLAMVDLLITRYNKTATAPLSIAHGFAVYGRASGESIYKSFARADSAMYSHKAIVKGRLRGESRSAAENGQ